MAYRNPQARELVGKRIVAFCLNAKYEKGRGMMHDPVIVLDDGTALRFMVEESDGDGYGVSVVRTKRKRKTSKEGHDN